MTSYVATAKIYQVHGETIEQCLRTYPDTKLVCFGLSSCKQTFCSSVVDDAGQGTLVAHTRVEWVRRRRCCSQGQAFRGVAVVQSLH